MFQKEQPKAVAMKKILVADDSLTIQKVIRLALSGDGYEIQTVSDGKEAVEQASLFRPDICIIDVSLPQLDAYQIREHLLSKPDLKNIPVILMSSAFEKIDETRAQSLTFAGHLIKPFDPSHLRSTLLSVVQHAPQNDPVTATINEPMHEKKESLIRLDPPSLQSPSQQHRSETSSMDDIQQLAKNTFEMSGLNQQDWGMIEPGKADFFHETPQHSPEVSSIDFNELAPASDFNENKFQVTSAELEQMVQAEVSRVFSELLRSQAESILPSLAEKIIKEEIHKLLSDPQM